MYYLEAKEKIWNLETSHPLILVCEKSWRSTP